MVTSRRTFTKGLVAAGVVAGVPVLGAMRVGAGVPPSYEITSRDGFAVKLTQGERFDLTVIRSGNGRIVEELRSIDAWQLMRTRSRYFTVRRIDPPVPTAA